MARVLRKRLKERKVDKGVKAVYSEEIQIATSVKKTDGTNFNVTKTSSTFGAQHDESDSDANLNYRTGNDLQQSTADQRLASEVGADADQSASGTLFFFSPANTTFVKHFMSNTNSGFGPNYSNQEFTGGYCNTTSAITGLKFLFNSGNIDAGTIKMYGIKKS